jgi:hypothetical protein
MEEKYLRFKNKLSAFVSEAKSIVENDSPKNFEDRQAYRIINQIYDDADLLLDKLEYLSKPAIEGKLREMDNEKFELISNSKSIAYFSCGSRIEIFDPEENEWHLGRVEHRRDDNGNGYYFFCSSMGHPFLYTGMRARIRRDY